MAASDDGRMATPIRTRRVGGIPVIPQRAATLLLVRDVPFEVLMVRRAASGTFASALVFPGGTLSEEDRSPDWLPLVAGGEALDAEERALRIAALRETQEEVGLLPLVDAAGADLPPPPHDPGRGFIDTVRASGGRLPLDRLEPFAHWITPEPAPRRFDTRFYLMRAAAGEAACDGAETVEARWCDPGAVAAGEPGLPFPTRLNLARLAEAGSVAAALAAARARPRFTVLPTVERRADGIWVVIPAEAGYATCEEHRPNGRLV